MSGATGAGPTGYVQFGAPIGNIIHNWGVVSDNNITAIFPKAFANVPSVVITSTGPTGPHAIRLLTTTGFLATCIGHPNTGGFHWHAWGT
jgi:hypothetical protein